MFSKQYFPDVNVAYRYEDGRMTYILPVKSWSNELDTYYLDSVLKSLSEEVPRRDPSQHIIFMSLLEALRDSSYHRMEQIAIAIKHMHGFYWVNNRGISESTKFEKVLMRNALITNFVAHELRTTGESSFSYQISAAIKLNPLLFKNKYVIIHSKSEYIKSFKYEFTTIRTMIPSALIDGFIVNEDFFNLLNLLKTEDSVLFSINTTKLYLMLKELDLL